MAWNGSGSFSRTNGVHTGTTAWQQDAAADVDIEADRHDTHDQDLANGINACLAKNGENAMTGDLAMGGNDILNAGAIAAASLTASGAVSAASLTASGAVSAASLTVNSVAITGAPYYPRTAAEIAAGVTPVDYSQPVAWITRYGTNTAPGTTDMTAAIQASIDANLGCIFGDETYAFSGITLPNNGLLKGAGSANTILSYTGAGVAVANPTPGTRIYRWNVSDLRVIDAGTGTTAFELDSVSLASFTNVEATNFAVGIDIYSPTSGYAVYNRFYNVLSQNPTGYRIRGLNSNANTFVSCRTNLATTRAVSLQDSNDNSFITCQFESGGDATAVELSAPGGAGRVSNNLFFGCRIEGYEGASSVGYLIGADCVATQIINPRFPGTDPAILVTDNGSRTMIPWTDSGTLGMKQISALPSARGTPFLFERQTSDLTGNIPAMIVRDSSTSAGTPTTLQIETGRTAGHLIRGMRGGNEKFGVLADGKIRTNQTVANVATPSGVTARAFPIYNESGTLLGYIPVYAAQWV